MSYMPLANRKLHRRTFALVSCRTWRTPPNIQLACCAVPLCACRPPSSAARDVPQRWRLWSIATDAETVRRRLRAAAPAREAVAAPHEQHVPGLRGVVAPVLRQRVFLSRERGRDAAQARAMTKLTPRRGAEGVRAGGGVRPHREAARAVEDRGRRRGRGSAGGRRRVRGRQRRRRADPVARGARRRPEPVGADADEEAAKATCLHGNGPECGSCAEIFAAPPSPLNWREVHARRARARLTARTHAPPDARGEQRGRVRRPRLGPRRNGPLREGLALEQRLDVRVARVVLKPTHCETHTSSNSRLNSSSARTRFTPSSQVAPHW